MTFDGFDVVVTPFLFWCGAEAAGSGAFGIRAVWRHDRYCEHRHDHHGAGVAMAVDVPVIDLQAAGLRRACVVRMKFASLDFRRMGLKWGC